ncbi:Leu/Ile/Val-binding protein [Candidatus Entotheonellaceae bacterium PAL068K]
MRRLIRTLTLGLLSIVGLFAGLMVDSVAQAQTIKIGVLTPLSVPGDASAGALIVRGARLGEIYVNTVMGGIRGGQKIALRVEDDTGVPEKGIAGYRKLVTQDEVAVVMGQYHSSVMLAVQKLADKMGIPIFATQASNQKITRNKYVTTFRTHAIDPDRITLLFGYVKERGYRRLAILAENTDYGIGLIEDARARNTAMGLGLSLKTIIFDRASVDMTAQLLEVNAWKPDLVFNAGVPPGALVMAKQAFDVRLFPQVPMLASFDWPIRPEYWQAMGDKGKWMLYISYYHPTMKRTPRGDWFAAQYKKRYNEPPVYTAFNAFGQIVFLSDAIDQAKSTRPEDVIASLESGSFQSWNGTVQFERGTTHWHQWSPPMMILQHTQLNQDWETAKIIYPPALKTGAYVSPR